MMIVLGQCLWNESLRMSWIDFKLHVLNAYNLLLFKILISNVIFLTKYSKNSSKYDFIATSTNSNRSTRTSLFILSRCVYLHYTNTYSYVSPAAWVTGCYRDDRSLIIMLYKYQPNGRKRHMSPLIVGGNERKKSKWFQQYWCDLKKFPVMFQLFIVSFNYVEMLDRKFK